MSNYDKQYDSEENLFGEFYSELEKFLRDNGKGGTALDLGCGQGRDALLLAKLGYRVTGVDVSEVGVSQMVLRGLQDGHPITGVIANIFDYNLSDDYDLILLDSILHFQKNDREKEISLLNKVSEHLAPQGFLIIVIHKSPRKEQEVKSWLKSKGKLNLIHQDYLPYTYEEKSSGFRSESEMCLFVMQNTEA